MHVCLLTSHIRRSSSLRYCWKKEREIADRKREQRYRVSYRETESRKRGRHEQTKKDRETGRDRIRQRTEREREEEREKNSLYEKNIQKREAERRY